MTITRHVGLRAAALLLGAAGCGDPLFFAAVDEERICFTQPGATVPGVDPTAVDVLGERTTTWDGTLDLAAHLPGLEHRATTGSLRLLTLTVNSGTDLRVIRSALLEVSDAPGQEWRPLMTYAQEGEGTATTLELAPAQLLDLFPLVHQGGQLRYRLTLSGSPPTEDWNADIVSCMSASLQLDALEALK